MPKISIIMPVYNVEKYVQTALESVINQTLTDIELICIDDCSQNASLNILKEFSLKDSRIKIIEQKTNQGQGVARNLGLEAATGEYIMFLDSDDWFEICACEDIYNQISKNDNDMLFFNIFTYNPLLKFGRIDAYRLHAFWGFSNKNFKLSDITIPFFTTAEIWYKAYKTSFLKDNNIRFTDIRLGEDGPFTTKAYLLAKSVSVLNKNLYNYRIARENSVSCADDTGKFNIYINEKLKDLELIHSNDDYLWLLKSYLPYFVNSIIYFYKKFKRNNNNIKDKVLLYNQMRKTFIELNNKYDMKTYLELIIFKFFMHTVKHNYFMSKIFK